MGSWGESKISREVLDFGFLKCDTEDRDRVCMPVAVDEETESKGDSYQLGG